MLLEHNSDPVRWVDAWHLPGLNENIRNKIKAQLLRAHAAFLRSSDREDILAHAPYMQLAFHAVAEILLQAKILTTETLGESLPELIWDAAISGGWWTRAGETQTDQFTDRFGHYWVNSDWGSSFARLFVAEISEWRARLLDIAGAVPPRDDEIARRWSDLERRNEQFLVSRRQAREQRQEERMQNYTERTTRELYEAQMTRASLREFSAQRKPSSRASDPPISPAIAAVRQVARRSSESTPAANASAELLEADPQVERAARRQAIVNPILQRKRWKPGRLGTEAGVSKNSVYQYLDGTRGKIKDENREAIAQALDLKPEQLPD